MVSFSDFSEMGFMDAVEAKKRMIKKTKLKLDGYVEYVEAMEKKINECEIENTRRRTAYDVQVRTVKNKWHYPAPVWKTFDNKARAGIKRSMNSEIAKIPKPVVDRPVMNRDDYRELSKTKKVLDMIGTILRHVSVDYKYSFGWMARDNGMFDFPEDGIREVFECLKGLGYNVTCSLRTRGVAERTYDIVDYLDLYDTPEDGDLVRIDVTIN
jgi:hypothetical protein